MTEFKNGDKVTINYRGEVFDGAVFIGVDPSFPDTHIVNFYYPVKINGKQEIGPVSFHKDYISKHKRTVDFWVNVYEDCGKLKTGNIYDTETRALAGLSCFWNHIETKKFTYTEPD